MSFVVIMAGGSGTRFWPRSRRAKPKQFLTLGGKNSLLQGTYATACKIVQPTNVYISTGRKYTNLVRRQLPRISRCQLILEPDGRDTAPSIALSSMILSKTARDGVAAFLPADHWINPEQAFVRTISQAIRTARRSRRIITIGIRPSHPSTGYGYIRVGEPEARERALRVVEFKEKPSKRTAEKYVSSGRYYWNSGIFVSRIDALLDEISVHAPDIHAQLAELSQISGSRFLRELNRRFVMMPRRSFDYAVMEKTDKAAMIPATFEWSDLGAWDSIAVMLPRGPNGNYSNGSVLSIESTGNITVNEKKLTALVGVRNLVVVEDEDVLLICSRGDVERVKQLVDILKKKKLARYL